MVTNNKPGTAITIREHGHIIINFFKTHNSVRIIRRLQDGVQSLRSSVMSSTTRPHNHGIDWRSIPNTFPSEGATDDRMAMGLWLAIHYCRPGIDMHISKLMSLVASIPVSFVIVAVEATEVEHLDRTV